MARCARWAFPLVAFLATGVHAAVTWDPTRTPASPVGGVGVWDNTSENTVWSTGSANVAWPGSTHVAVFGGTTAGNVTLGSDVAAAGVQFGLAGYSLDGVKTLTLGPGGLNTGSLTSGGVSLNANVALAGNQTWLGNGGVTLNVGAIGGTGNLVLASQGNDANRSRLFINLNGVSTYSGSTTLEVSSKSQIEIGFGVSNALPTATVLTLNTANKGTSSIVLNLKTTSQTVAGLVASGDTTNTQILGSGTLTLDGPADSAYSGLIGGSVKLVKAGGGKQILSATNTYQGGTTISGGTLVANNATNSLGSKPTTINSGGTLAGNGATGLFASDTPNLGSVVINSGGRITAGDGATVADAAGRLTTGNQTWKAGGKYVIKFSDNTAGTLNANGTRSGGSAATWDTLAMATLDLKGLSAASPFVLSLARVTGGTFATNANRQFVLATTGSLLTAAAPSGLTQRTDLTSLFTLDTTGLGVTADRFTVAGVMSASGGADLVLSYGTQAAPEPATLLLAALAAWPLLGRRRL